MSFPTDLPIHTCASSVCANKTYETSLGIVHRSTAKIDVSLLLPRLCPCHFPLSRSSYCSPLAVIVHLSVFIPSALIIKIGFGFQVWTLLETKLIESSLSLGLLTELAVLLTLDDDLVNGRFTGLALLFFCLAEMRYRIFQVLTP